MPFGQFWKKKLASSQENPSDKKDHIEAEPEHGLFLVSKIADPWNNQAEALHNVDIVFVHGLHGHYRKTWTYTKDSRTFFWPSDYLNTLPGTRVFSFGYQSGGLRITRSDVDIRDIAKDLLEALRSKRYDAEARSRPILFISHSLGGIVVKQAVFLAKNDPEYSSLWQATKAIIFFGTPHRGSGLANNGLLLAMVFNAASRITLLDKINGSMNTATLDLLQKDRKQLNHITSDFLGCLGARPELKIVSFYETKKLAPLDELVVNQASAQLGVVGESCIPLNADHREMCRFSGLNDPDLERVGFRINELIMSSLQSNKTRSISSNSLTASIEGAVKDCAPLLNTVDWSQYTDIAKRMARGTLSWLHNVQQYADWVASANSSILWVSGSGGSGKTTLAVYVKQSLLDEKQAPHIVASFFCDDGDEKQRNGLFILQSLIYQIVEQCRALWSYVTKAKDRHGFPHLQRLDGLWQILEQIIKSQMRPKITILLDAIDECESKTRASILDRLCSLSTTEKDTSLKIFVTSRLDARSTLGLRENDSTVSDILLDQHRAEIAQDISLTINQTLQRLIDTGRCQPEVRNAIAAALTEKADKTFLWARFAVEYLERSRSLFLTSLSDLKTLMPSGLENMYAKYLSTIPEEDATNAAKILHYLIACDRPLTAEELSILIAMDSVGEDPVVVLQNTPFINERQIINLLGSLVRIESGTIHLAHLTLKDYLTSLTPENSLSPIFAVNIIEVKGVIACTCARYIKLCLESRDKSDQTTSDSASFTSASPNALIESASEIEPDLLFGMNIFEHLSREAKVSQTTNQYLKSFKLFDYAALHWQQDVRTVFSDNIHQKNFPWDLALAVYERDDEMQHDWFRYVWSKQLPMELFPSTVDSLLKATFAGHLPVVQRILEQANIESDSVSRALYWAVRYDHEACVDTLISHISRSDLEKTTDTHPLFVAAEYGSLHSMALLLKLEPLLLNRQTNAGKTALMLASRNGHAALARMLLQKSDIDIGLHDTSGRTALHWAVYSESSEITSMLLDDGRTRLNHQDRYGRTAFIDAAESGLLDIVKLFLKQATLSINGQDNEGRTALSHACGKSHLSVAKRLCKVPGIDFLLADKHGRVAHSWAASQKNLEILRLLASNAPEGINIPDHDGWAAFAWTLGPPAILANAAALLEIGGIDVNRKDETYGRPLLSWLAGYGETALLKLFLYSPGLDKHATDKLGRTPLMDAAIAGHTNTVVQLLSEEFTDVNARDNRGRSALALAAREGRIETVLLLAGTPGIRLDDPDEDGLTPLKAAGQFGHTATIEALKACLP